MQVAYSCQYHNNYWVPVITLRVEHVWSFVSATLIQSYLTLYDPMAYSPPGFSVPGILQAKILEWVVMPCSRGSSQPRDWIWVSFTSLELAEGFTTIITWEAPFTLLNYIEAITFSNSLSHIRMLRGAWKLRILPRVPQQVIGLEFQPSSNSRVQTLSHWIIVLLHCYVSVLIHL